MKHKKINLVKLLKITEQLYLYLVILNLQISNMK